MNTSSEVTLKVSNVALPNEQTSSSTYPWLVIALCSLFLIYKYILQVSPSVMTNELMQTFHVGGAGLGNLAAAYFYSFAFFQLIAGSMLDKYSLRLLTSGAIAVSALGIYVFAHTHSLLDASLARALIGAGAAFATVSYMKAAAVWFKPRQFAFVGGLLATAAMVGAMFGEEPLSVLVSHVDWRQSLFYCAILGVVIALLFLLLVRDKQTTHTDQSQVQLASPPIKWADFVAVIKNKDNWLLTFYSGLAFSPIDVFGGLWGNAFLQAAHHITRQQAASLTSLAFFGLALGSPLLGLLSDRIGRRFPIMVIGLLISLVAMIGILYLPNTSTMLLGTVLFLFGFGTGAFMLGFTIGKELNRAALAATIIALINTGDALFSAFTEPLTGKILDILGHGKIVNGVHYFSVQDFHIALALLPLYLCLGLVFLALMKNKN